MLLLRHASAGERLSSPSDDRARTLDRTGRADARRLPSVLAGHAIDRIVASPQARCVATVDPIARARDLDIEHREELAPDAALRDLLALLAELSDSTLVCTHREVVEKLFAGQVTCEKAGTWLLERRRRRWLPVAYLPPPASAHCARRKAALV